MIAFECPKCGSNIPFEKADMDLCFQSRVVICPSCFTDILSFNSTIKQIEDFIEGLG